MANARGLTLLCFAVVGTLQGFDALVNLVLDDTVEYLRGQTPFHYQPFGPLWEPCVWGSMLPWPIAKRSCPPIEISSGAHMLMRCVIDASIHSISGALIHVGCGCLAVFHKISCRRAHADCY